MMPTIAATDYQINMAGDERSSLESYYTRIRQRSEDLCRPLEIEDYGIQTMTSTSPPKWHLAHTSWFFETLLLKPLSTGYREFHPLFAHLFNSYYETLGSFHPRAERGHLSRPTVSDVYRYREYVDNHMALLLSDDNNEQRDEIIRRTVLGLNHEQQHQELLLTDIKHNFANNPLQPIYRVTQSLPPAQAEPVCWIQYQGGIREIGHAGNHFAYDNEMPRHKVYINDFSLASRPVTNGEYTEFIDAGAYLEPELWLSDGWKIVTEEHWQAPLYWQLIDGDWWYMTLGGLQRIDLHAPVCHVSHYEAAAFARWRGKRLPSEVEWEMAAADLPIRGNFYESGRLQPVAGDGECPLLQMYGDVWEWTQSAYTAYPGYRQVQGTLGEYNGKFMSGQMVLRGGSCVTATDHIRASYRNFFPPLERWQFSGFRLAEDG